MFQGLKFFFKKMFHGLGTIVVTCIFLIAIYLLYNEIRKYSFTELSMSVERIPNWSLLISFLFAILNYIILIGYDWLALKAINKTLPLYKVFLVSFIGQAVSYNFGALLGGSTVRYRFYTSWGFSPIDIVKLILMLAITFWVGALGLAGAIFLFIPPEIPPDLALYFPVQNVRPLGFILLFISIAYLVACKYIHMPISIGGKEFSFPPFHIAVTQAIVASADLVVAGACLYVLLPENTHVSFFQFLPMYLMAMVAVVLTHVPGGAGVLEVTILHLTDISPQDVIAALLCFRVIYYLIPLLIAVVVFLGYELHRQTEENIRFWQKAFLYIKIHIPMLLSICVFAIGCVFVFIVMLPINAHKLKMLLTIFPHWVIDVCSIITGVSGVVLLFFSKGLKYKKKKAFYLSILFIFTGCIGIILFSFNVIVSSSIACIGGLFLYLRHSFCVKSSVWETDFNIRWFVIALSVFICATGLGFTIRHIEIGNIFSMTSGYIFSMHRIIGVIVCEALVVLFLIIKCIEVNYIKVIQKNLS